MLLHSRSICTVTSSAIPPLLFSLCISAQVCNERLKYAPADIVKYVILPYFTAVSAAALPALPSSVLFASDSVFLMTFKRRNGLNLVLLSICFVGLFQLNLCKFQFVIVENALENGICKCIISL